jgi:hypothetical protein
MLRLDKGIRIIYNVEKGKHDTCRRYVWYHGRRDFNNARGLPAVFLNTVPGIRTFRQWRIRSGLISASVLSSPARPPLHMITLKARGYLLANPEETVESTLRIAVDEIFSPQNSSVSESLAGLILDAERAYFDRVYAQSGNKIAGEFDFEPLVGDNAGPPIYLDRLSPTQQQEYGKELESIDTRLKKLAASVKHKDRLNDILRAIQNVLADISRK